MSGSICISKYDIQLILDRYKCINSYQIEESYFSVDITIYVNESMFLMDVLSGNDLRKELEELKYMVPLSVQLNIYLLEDKNETRN